MLTDAHGNGVVAIPPAPRSPYGTPAHVRGGITLTGSAPDASSADGNTTVLVLGTAFRNFWRSNPMPLPERAFLR